MGLMMEEIRLNEHSSWIALNEEVSVANATLSSLSPSFPFGFFLNVASP